VLFVPVETDFTGTKSTDEAMVRAKYKTIVECPNVGAVTVSDGEGIGLIQDVAFIRTGTTGSPLGAYAVRAGRLVMDRCALFGFTNAVQARELGQATLTNCQLAYGAASGVLIQQGGWVKATSTLIVASGNHGIEASQSQFVSDTGLRVKTSAAVGIVLGSSSRASITAANFSGNTGMSAQLVSGCVLEISGCTLAGGAGQPSLVVSDGSAAYVTAVTVSGDATQRALTAQRGSVMTTAGTHTGTPVFSPAIGATGNSGSWAF
jgi:hypothetical protein